MQRFWEIDAVRGIAVILMVLFHSAYSFNHYLAQYGLDLNQWGWICNPSLTMCIFILVSGVSLTISYNRRKNPVIRFAIRGLKIFLLGLLITAYTFFVFPREIIWFGILHFIGIATILSLPFAKMKKKWNLAIGSSIVLLGIYLNTVQFGSSWLSWLVPSHFVTLNYVPVLPWFGFTLIGIAFGNWLFPNGKRKFIIREPNGLEKFFALLGRNSLMIFFLHKMLIDLVMSLLGPK